VSPDSVETQPERTSLAWQRTGLGVLAVAALLAHGAVRSGSPLLFALACVTALAGLAVLGALGPLRYRQVRRRLTAGTAMPAPGMAAAVAAAVLLACAAAVVGVVMPG
jgi:putative membrane protein